MLVRVSANYHWAEMTSVICMFVSIRYLSKYSVEIYYIVLIII